MGTESPEVQMARLEERLKVILARLDEARSDQQTQQHLSNEHLQTQAEQFLPNLITQLSRGENIDAALAMLSELSPDKDLDALQDDLEQMIFASNVLGRLSVNESRKAVKQEDE